MLPLWIILCYVMILDFIICVVLCCQCLLSRFKMEMLIKFWFWKKDKRCRFSTIIINCCFIYSIIRINFFSNVKDIDDVKEKKMIKLDITNLVSDLESHQVRTLSPDVAKKIFEVIIRVYVWIFLFYFAI